MQKILSDIYESDPGLRAREREIIAIIEDLIRAKPDTQFDENFRRQLKARIMQRIAAMPSEPYKKIGPAWFTVPRLAYAMGGVAVLALIILPVLYFTNKGANFALPFLAKESANVIITKLADNAFGKLTAGQNNAASAESASVQTSPAAPQAARNASDLGVGLSSPGGAPSAGSGSAVAGSAGSGVSGAAVSPTMMPVRPANYKYVYKGGDLPSLPDRMDVLQRMTGGGALALNSVMANTGLNFIDWSKFSDTKLQNISFQEDRDNGYQVYINFDDGSVSINKNWAGGVVAYATPMETQNQPVKITDVPADAKIIDVADNFFRDYGISKANYGQPFVQNNWRVDYEAAMDKAGYWIPDNMQVIYPLIINGKEVYDETGNKYGLIVSVDIRAMDVTAVSNLMTQNYQSSAYDTEKDNSRIIKLAENGGFRQNYYWYGGMGEAQSIELGIPSLKLVQMWFYRDNKNQQLLVPAYVFPVTNKPTGGYYYQDSVIVPVIKDVLDWGNSGGGGVVVPMMKGEVQSLPESAPSTQIK